MVQCTKGHFAGSGKIQNEFDRMGMSQRVCPPLNSSFQVSGKYALQNLHTIEIKITQCSSNNASRPCLSDTFIDAYVNVSGAVYATLIYTNTLINPGS